MYHEYKIPHYFHPFDSSYVYFIPNTFPKRDVNHKTNKAFYNCVNKNKVTLREMGTMTRVGTGTKSYSNKYLQETGINIPLSDLMRSEERRVGIEYAQRR